MTTEPHPGQPPVFYTFAQPVPNSLPLFVVRDTKSGKPRLITDPCELCTRVRLSRKESIYKSYDGKVEYAGFLGYVLRAPDARSNVPVYANMTGLVTDRSYFPATKTNKTLKAVLRRTKGVALEDEEERAFAQKARVEIEHMVRTSPECLCW